MLKKIVSIMSVVALSFAFVGCDAAVVADKAKTGVDKAAGAGHDAAAEVVPDAAKEHVDSTRTPVKVNVLREVVPDAAKEHVDGAIDAGGDKTKEAIDSAAGTPAAKPAE